MMSFFSQLFLASVQDLVDFALQALCATAAADQEINGNILHVGVVGEDFPWLGKRDKEVCDSHIRIECI